MIARHLAQINPLYNPTINQRIGNAAVTPAAGIMALVLNNLITLALSIAGLYFFYNLVRGGYEWISAGGDKEAAQKARIRLTNAVVGIVVTFSVFALVKVVEYFFGFNILSFNIPRP